MEEYKEGIENAINQLLRGELSVVAFQRVFYWFYLEQIPGELLSDEEWNLYSAIDAALDRVAAAADPQEFIEWVRNQGSPVLMVITQPDNQAISKLPASEPPQVLYQSATFSPQTQESRNQCQQHITTELAIRPT